MVTRNFTVAKGVLVSVQLDLSWLVHHFLQQCVGIGKVQASVSPCPSDFISWAPSQVNR